MLKILDCTLRDGGYYNMWDFEPLLVQEYLYAMEALQIDYVEIGFRSLINDGFKGGFAYSSDTFLKSLKIPLGLVNKISVMINGSEIAHLDNQESCLEQLFDFKSESPVSLVRIACHVHEFSACLPAANWLKGRGYLVGFNLMQVADRKPEEITQLSLEASKYPIDVLYFADSMGSLYQDHVTEIILAFQKGWHGPLGIHAHDNMGMAITNSVHAWKKGVIWVDSTVTGMGRGPGNAQTEYLIFALAEHRQSQGNPTKLFKLVRSRFKQMQNSYGWGTNPYYYLAGKYGIHPSYVQEMLQDSRYSEEDCIAVIEKLRHESGKKFSLNTLQSARTFYLGEPHGTWQPSSVVKDRPVLILGAGPTIKKHQSMIESFIEQQNPYVIALNTQSNVRQDLIHARAACHPVRLLADCHQYRNLPQPLITPASMLPNIIVTELQNKRILDFGITVTGKRFQFFERHCELPNGLVIAYALAIANSGSAKQIILAGFDGYDSGDPRNKEMDQLFNIYMNTTESLSFFSVTPTRYEIPVQSIYGMNL